MANYLRIAGSDFKILLDAVRVHEILDAGADAAHARYLEWRGRVLRTVSLRTLLGAHCGPTTDVVAVVYEPEGAIAPIVLIVDRVLGLESVEESGFLALPPLPEAVERLFSKVRLDPVSGEQAYLLAAHVGEQEAPLELEFPAGDEDVSEPEDDARAVEATMEIDA